VTGAVSATSLAAGGETQVGQVGQSGVLMGELAGSVHAADEQPRLARGTNLLTDRRRGQEHRGRPST
jgi:hypothetical protein